MRPFGAARLIVCLVPLGVLMLVARSFAADEIIGSIKNARGAAVVVRDGQRLPAAAGFKLHASDTLETGADARIGAILRDDSLLSLGPSSSVAVERFLFTPAEGRLGLTVRVRRGTMAFLSGLIGRLAPDSTIFVTPVATLGVRGTHVAVKVAE